jgi:uncharacterized protein YcaQ
LRLHWETGLPFYDFRGTNRIRHRHFVVKSSDVISLSVDAARRFHRRAAGLDAPHAGVGAAIAYHGYVQIDPINVCGRMHDLILRNRVADYAEGDLMRHVHGVGPRDNGDGTVLRAEGRVAFEHYLPGRGILVAHELGAWKYLREWMRGRERLSNPGSGRFDAEQRAVAKDLLAEMAGRGALSGDDFEDARRSKNDWGTHGSIAKGTLDKLFYHGRVLIARRNGNGARRVYDLPERLLPADVLKEREAGAEETARWLVMLKMRQHRLVALKRGEAALVEDAVCAVRVRREGVPVLHVLREDLGLLEESARGASGGGAPPLLLAPLDPLIYDRNVTRRLWGFDYTWEVYTPPAKRVRGYYALPVLSGVEIVGHVDPKADRERGRLAVMGRSLRRGHKAGDALKGLARFLGLMA